uniref:Uncharacterized protein n=1 Tax=viral metagenome TaxID=1070528 RepID=A0A6M3IP46_9ZZZZ
MKLQNQDIWLAYPSLVRLSEMRLPVDVGLGIAKLIKKLQGPYHEIEQKRKGFVQQYGTIEKGEMRVYPDSPNAGDFSVDFGQFLVEEWRDDFEIERVIIPTKIEGECIECGRNMDVVFLIDPQILIPLVKDFVACQ